MRPPASSHPCRHPSPCRAAIKIDISPPPGYAPYLDGLERGVFLKGANGDPYVGQASGRKRLDWEGLGWGAAAARWAGRLVAGRAARHTWPVQSGPACTSAAPPTHTRARPPGPSPAQSWSGGVHWPDFVFNPQADEYWQELLRGYANQSEWGGLWLAMNEGARLALGDQPAATASCSRGPRCARGVSSRAALDPGGCPRDALPPCPNPSAPQPPTSALETSVRCPHRVRAESDLTASQGGPPLSVGHS